MPAKGKHRRPKNNRVTRSIAAAGTGGAALALPLMGATGAHAAAAKTPVASEKTAPVTQVDENQAAASKEAEKAQKAESKKTGARIYSVARGDYLAKIADEQNVSGGWEKLYADNREVIGGDPSLIHPGLKLTIGGKARSGGSGTEGASSSGFSAPVKKAATSTAPAPSSDTDATSGYAAPVSDTAVTTAYRASGGMWSSGYHTGVDFAAPTGTSVKSIAAGTVVSAGWGGSYGNQVVIQHADGRYSQYGHLSQLSVSAGQSVSAGLQIGLSGSTGNSSGPHLHFEVRTSPSYGSDVDPLAYLRQHGVSL
jgi:murein DD-endopeptidase MepM/ murein hydrolase activator NlpD